MKPESDIQQEIQIAGAPATILMRNNSGMFKAEDGRWVRFGLGHTSKNQAFASSDLIGITTVKITPDMVGKEVGIFTAVEVKEEAWNPDKKLDAREEQQSNFIQWIKMLGGIATFANSREAFLKAVDSYLAELRR